MENGGIGNFVNFRLQASSFAYFLANSVVATFSSGGFLRVVENEASGAFGAGT
jgi:hypothetical protein